MLRSLEFEAGGHTYRADLARPQEIGIPLRFAGPQPSFFAAPPASAVPLRAGAFVGDVQLGGSCRCSTVQLTPHCNGTHTECIGHVVREPVAVHAVTVPALTLAVVVSVQPVRADTAGAECGPEAEADDCVITTASLAATLPDPLRTGCTALVVRTVPNPPDKAGWQYGTTRRPAYFTAAAMHWIVSRGIRQLVVDVPSVDRMHDAGRLAAHRIFWGLPPDSSTLADARRADATITELAFLHDGIADGVYLLDLQVSAFDSDAAPSRPVLYPLTEVTR